MGREREIEREKERERYLVTGNLTTVYWAVNNQQFYYRELHL